MMQCRYDFLKKPDDKKPKQNPKVGFEKQRSVTEIKSECLHTVAEY